MRAALALNHDPGCGMIETGAQPNTSKTMGKAAEAAAGWPSVRAFLLSHANLVRDDAALLSELGLRVNAANVVEFGPAALARQIAAHQRESNARLHLEVTARANFAAQAQCHAGVIDLLDSRNNADLARRVDDTAKLRFALVGAALAVEGPAPAGWRALNPGMVDAMIGADALVAMGPNLLAHTLFGQTGQPIESCALIRLALWSPARPGILAFASPDADGFSPEMGVELIALLAQVVERTAERWPAA